MLPGVTPGRGLPPGRGPPAPGPGRGPPGPWGLGIGRSTGCCDENGLLPTRGGRGAPGLGPGCAADGRGAGVGPGVGPGVGAGRTGAGVGAAAAAGARGGAGGAGGGGGGVGAAGFGPPGLGPGVGPTAAGRSTGAAGAAGAGALTEAAPLPAGALGAAAGILGADGAPADFPPPPNDSRSRRATGASTVDDADLTNSPCSLNRARTSLLVTPSSFANSCTRALPATTSPRLEAAAEVGPTPRV